MSTPDLHDRVMNDLRLQRAQENVVIGKARLRARHIDEKKKAEEARAKRPLAFRVDYEVWDVALGYFRKCSFFLFAPDVIEARVRAVRECRDKNGQPIDFHDMRVELVKC
jgi:hypothetical protein